MGQQVEWRLTDAKNLADSDLTKLFRSAKKIGPRPHLLMVLAYNGALRVSELIHLKVEDFNWNTGKLAILPLKKAGKRRMKQMDGTIKVVERPLPRPVEYPLPANVLDMVRQYIKDQKLGREGWLFPGFVKPNGCHIVALDCPGGHVCKRKVQMLWDQAADMAGIKVNGRGIHALKHGRLTEVARKTKDPYLVKEIGRHSSVALSDHYVKYVDLKDRIDEIGGRV